MKINIENEMGGTDLVTDSTGLSPYAEAVLSANEIKGLVRFRIRNKNNKKEYCYDISGRISLEKYYSRRSLPYVQLKAIVSSVVDLIRSTEEYLLDAEYISFAPEFIFTDEHRQKYEYCLLKADEKTCFEGIRELAAFLLRKADHNDEECVNAAYKLFELVSEEGYLPEELLTVFEKTAPEFGSESDNEVLFDDPYAAESAMYGVHQDGYEPEEKAIKNFEYKCNDEGRRIIAEYEVEDPAVPDWLNGKESFFSERSLKKLIALMLPVLGTVIFACLFALGLMNDLPLWLKIVCPGLVISSLVLTASVIWPKPERSAAADRRAAVQ